MRTCVQCGKAINDGWLPCCPRPSDCYQRYIRGLPPRRPTVVSEPDQNGVPAPLGTIPIDSETAGNEGGAPEKPWVPRRGSRHLEFYDLEGLGQRITTWMRNHGATNGRLIRIRTMQKQLSLHRYAWWRAAVSYLQQRKVIRVEERDITLIDDSWGLVRKTHKPKRRRPRTDWFEEHLPQFLGRDGLA
jgi:hypothetical protein